MWSPCFDKGERMENYQILLVLFIAYVAGLSLCLAIRNRNSK